MKRIYELYWNHFGYEVLFYSGIGFIIYSILQLLQFLPFSLMGLGIIMILSTVLVSLINIIAMIRGKPKY